MSEPRPVTVGLAGTGKVGSAIAAVLAAAGAELVLANRTRAKAEAVADLLCASVVDSPSQLVEQCDVVYTCISDWHATWFYYTADNGLLAAARAKSVFIELGTRSPEQVDQLAAAADSGARRFLYACPSGRPIDLQSGRGFVMASGSAEAFQIVEDALRLLGTLRYVGPEPAHAAVMKLALNAAAFAALCSTAETLTLATRSGIDTHLAYDLLLESPVGSPLLKLRRDAFLDPETTVQATIDLTVDNYALVQELARATGTNMPQALTNAQIFADASAAGFGARDATSIHTYIRSLADTEGARP